jgi:predicted acyl esterase
LRANCHDQNVDNVKNRFLDDEYYASRDYNMEDIKVPLLSVGNWGGILLHLRGNVEGFMNAGSQHKYLRFITGRHDLPFYTKECVDMQRSFLDAFLKGNDPTGWSTGKPPKVGFKLRVGDVGYNDAVAEKAYPTRYEDSWPIPDTKYTRYFLTPARELTTQAPKPSKDEKVSYEALGDLKHQHLVQFTSAPFNEETEFTGHIVAHLNVSVSATDSNITPSDMDLFLTVRHLNPEGKEILYTGTVGDPVPITKGWLRVSLRKTNEKSPRHHAWHPHREYLSSDHAPLAPGDIYPVDVEIWPTNVVLQKGDRLVFEISSGDTQGAGLFEHTSKEDRAEGILKGMNHIHFGPQHENWLLMPVIPARAAAEPGK